ncbi:MAG: GGDEF domain-containing protein [Pseudomonadota bacterium]
MRRLATFLAIALIALVPHAHAANAHVDELLREADRIRSSDVRAFDTLLVRLQTMEPDASPRQRDHLRLLRNYRAAMAGRYEEAMGDAIVLHDQARDPAIKYRAALLVANASALTRDFLLGLRYLERGLAMRASIADAEVRHAGHTVAGTLYNEFGQHRLALEYSNALLAESPSPRMGCIARQNRVQAMHGLGFAIDEDADIHQAISDCLASKEPIPANLIRLTLAQRWLDKGQAQRAAALLKASLPEVRATRYPRLIGGFLGLLSQARAKEGDMAAAEAFARAVLALPGQDPRWRPVADAHEVLYRVALTRGDEGAALDHYRAYADADRARMDDIKAREYAFQLSRHELAQKNQSIAMLSNQNQVLRLQQEVARRSAWNFRLAIALLAVVAASAAYWGWRARRMHRSLHQLANTDGLTGLANRRHFRASTEAMLKACEQRARPVSVLLFDLDYFKQINDQCGHSSGDWVLREVARVGRQHCREGDLYGRIGGEEFAMALVDCDVDAALRIAERCRLSIEGIDATTGTGCPLPVAASIGVVSTSVSGYDYEMLIAHADAAMYRSKVAGRNRVTLYQPPPVPEAGRVVALDSRNAGAMLREY